MNFGTILDVFFPPACLACGDQITSGVVCEPCRAGITLHDTLFCGTCLARLPDGRKICHLDAPYLLAAAASYDDHTIQSLIHGLKFQGITGAAAPLAALLVNYVTRLDPPLDLADRILIPMPLSFKRMRARGFNQSALIARQFAAAFGLTVEERAIARIIHRKPQSETEDILERHENIRGVFAPGPAASTIEGKRVILIDDVVTSGTTFTEAARVLKESGAKKILALAVAKA